MSQLSPCPACSRHVRIAEPSCPFCAAPLPSRRPSPARAFAPGRLSRAAIFALGAAMLSPVACEDDSDCTGPNCSTGLGGVGGSASGGAGGTASGGASGSGAGGAAGDDAGTTADGAAPDASVAIYSAAFPPRIGG